MSRSHPPCHSSRSENNLSDLNHLKVVTATSDKYADCFGFTEEEVFDALDEYGMSAQKQRLKEWYDGLISACKQQTPYGIISLVKLVKYDLFVE